ncbi:MAG TPA: septum formation initiator family protein [Bacteroidetes bacterium]|nr:septum formation initiator family protein [Bacteroidota bacterium]
MLRKIIFNKYFYTGTAFLIWILFFDQDNFGEQYRLSQTLNDLRNKEEYYQAEIVKNKQKIKLLETDSAYLEKFAREKYYMKKDNEEVFVIINENKEE